ncbi:hypothetical protein L336_0882 [Candidatus Saccharimonas aalborgensis]|uniref:Uncharacterized protein n=1 Tax=Candidatus Saccharimonas aalborgensis TaxID=1332188 RepID=R4PNM6_9BACT|nr:hypothetical protein L336_0882 [Candidatus Saccharimonas aalborgensis]
MSADEAEHLRRPLVVPVGVEGLARAGRVDPLLEVGEVVGVEVDVLARVERDDERLDGAGVLDRHEGDLLPARHVGHVDPVDVADGRGRGPATGAVSRRGVTEDAGELGPVGVQADVRATEQLLELGVAGLEGGDAGLVSECHCWLPS